ncbi:MAG TPA: hypothetical protein VE967_01125 [Gemmatimonadaceae bacterium]|nr:hypothetical protein [Gemmatimonadaceae bacterium]
MLFAAVSLATAFLAGHDTVHVRSDVLARTLSNRSACTLTASANAWTSSPSVVQVGKATILPSGRVALFDLDRGKLRIIGSTGADIAAVGARGAGPGEFGARAVFTQWPGDTVAVADPETSRISLFTARGFERSQPMGRVVGVARSLPLARFADGTLLFVTGIFVPGTRSPYRQTFGLMRWDLAADSGVTIRDSLPGTEMHVFRAADGHPTFAKVNFGRMGTAAGNASYVVAHDDAKPHFDVMTPAGKIIRTIVLDAPDPVVTPYDRDTVLARVAKMRPSVIPGANEAMRTVPDRRTLATLLAVDQENGIWIVLYPSAQGEQPLYVRLGIDGVPTHCARGDEETRVIAFGAGTLVTATARDEGDAIAMRKAVTYPR